MLRPGGQERTFDLVPGCADRAHKAPINRERTEMTYGVPAGGPRTGPPFSSPLVPPAGTQADQSGWSPKPKGRPAARSPLPPATIATQGGPGAAATGDLARGRPPQQNAGQGARGRGYGPTAGRRKGKRPARLQAARKGPWAAMGPQPRSPTPTARDRRRPRATEPRRPPPTTPGNRKQGAVLLSSWWLVLPVLPGGAAPTCRVADPVRKYEGSAGRPPNTRQLAPACLLPAPGTRPRVNSPVHFKGPAAAQERDRRAGANDGCAGRDPPMRGSKHTKKLASGCKDTAREYMGAIYGERAEKRAAATT